MFPPDAAAKESLGGAMRTASLGSAGQEPGDAANTRASSSTTARSPTRRRAEVTAPEPGWARGAGRSGGEGAGVLPATRVQDCAAARRTAASRSLPLGTRSTPFSRGAGEGRRGLLPGARLRARQSDARAHGGPGAAGPRPVAQIPCRALPPRGRSGPSPGSAQPGPGQDAGPCTSPKGGYNRRARGPYSRSVRLSCGL